MQSHLRVQLVLRCPVCAGVAGGSNAGDPSCAQVACRLCCRRTPRSSLLAICELNRPEHTTGSRPELTGPATPKPAGPRVKHLSFRRGSQAKRTGLADLAMARI